MKHKTEMTRT